MNFILHVWRQRGPDDPGRFETYPAKDIRPDMSFLDYAKHLHSLNDLSDPHLLPQSDSILRCGSGRLIVGQLERIEKQWPQLVRYLCMDCSDSIEYINKAGYDLNGADYGGFDKAAALVRDVYAIDFDEYWEYLDEAGTPIQAVDYTTLEEGIHLAYK